MLTNLTHTNDLHSRQWSYHIASLHYFYEIRKELATHPRGLDSVCLSQFTYTFFIIFFF